MSKKMEFISMFSCLLLMVMGFTSNTVLASTHDKQSMIERGKYIVTIGGCNDCHTPGYLISEGKVPVSQWLIGNRLGWQGGWGTTYPRNLRLFVKDMTEDQWVITARTLKRRPPMPWFNLNVMKEEDLRDIYQFIKSLGAPGVQAPAYVPPGKKVAMPYVVFPPPPHQTAKK